MKHNRNRWLTQVEGRMWTDWISEIKHYVVIGTNGERSQGNMTQLYKYLLHTPNCMNFLCHPIRDHWDKSVRKPDLPAHTRSIWNNARGGPASLPSPLTQCTGRSPLEGKARQSVQRQGSTPPGQAHQRGGSSFWGETRHTRSPISVNVMRFTVLLVLVDINPITLNHICSILQKDYKETVIDL